MKPTIIIGIDPGVNTGLSTYDIKSKSLLWVRSIPIHKAMEYIKLFDRETTFIRFEDARLRKWFGNSGRDQLQGAGSIKRDCKIWEDYLTDLGFKFEKVAPKNNKTKMDSKLFKKVTGFKNQTNEHGRDSAMLIFFFI